MRCNSCNRFVSDTAEVDSIDVGVEAGVISGTVTVVRYCSECGDSVGTCDLDVQAEDALAAAHVLKFEDTEESHDLTWDGEGEVRDEFEGSGRRPKHLYKVHLTGKLTCDCGEVFDFEGDSDSVSGSEFEPY